MDELNRLKEWWQKPTLLDAGTQQMTQKILEKYPWFTPARLLSFMQQQEQAGRTYFPPAQEYSYNPMKYYEALQQMRQTDVLPISEELLSPEELQEIKEQDKAAEDNIIPAPFSAEDYFKQQGVEVSNDIPETPTGGEAEPQDEPKDLMVMRDFGDWLNFFQSKKQEEEEEEESKRALKLLWQREKLTAAMEEEEEEIPDQVFNMAMKSVQQDDEPLSETFAAVLAKQGKTEKAIEMYEKLSLKNPDKSNFFAAQIEKLRQSFNK